MAENGKIKIHVLHCGLIRLSPRAICCGGGRLSDSAAELFAPERERVELPVSAYLIEHPKGLLLVDTGWSRDISPRGVYDAKAVRSVLPSQLAALYRPSLPEGQALSEQLAHMGIRPEDLDCILLTHLDADHVSGLKELGTAKRILLAEEERWWTVRTVYRLRQPQALWANYPVEVFWYKGSPVGPNRWCYNLFGDESVQLVSVPGHTDGMFAVLVRNNGRFVLLSSDAAFSSRSWQNMEIPGFGFNRQAQEKSLRWVREMSMSPDCLASLANHDPDIKPHVLEL